MSAKFEDEEMLEILQSYLIESNEILELLTTCLIELEKTPDDNDLINKIFRYFHTIKGTSSFMGFDDIAKLTHSAEDLLNKTRRGELKVTTPIVDALMDSRDRLELMVTGITVELSEPVEYQDLVERITKLSHGEEAPISEKPIIKQVETVESKSSVLHSVVNNTDLFKGTGDFSLEEMELLEKAFAEVNSELKKQDDISTSVADSDEITEEINNEAISDDSPVIDVTIDVNIPSEEIIIEKPLVQNNTENQTKQVQATKNVSATETIRIDIKRIESLMDLSGELVLGRNRLSQITNRIQSGSDSKSLLHELVETTNQIDLITSEIQTAVMKMRMVPIGRLFQKAPKIVRDLSKEFGKKITLTLEGEDTEVDRGIIEELNDPLVHMLRNSCDHGIETAEERAAAGKNPTGLIKLVAYHEGNHIIIKISDDGKGINPEIVLKKAIDKGFVTQEQAKSMTDWEVYQLIFKPGFSTAKNVTAVSGRGVGMDVVKTNINKLKGIIEINSKVGSGSEFTVKLPLTLAIIQGLLVKSGKGTYALPLSSVVEVVAFDEASVHHVNKGRVIRIRDEVIPLITLDEITDDISSGNSSEKYVVNIAVGIDRVGLVVEQLLGQQEIVIKSLGNYLVNIEGIAGSTIIGDGRVIMILDTQGIIKKFKELQH